MADRQSDMDWIWSFMIALVAIMVLHQPDWSLQRLLIGSRTVSSGEMIGLKFLVGLVTSLLILGLCASIVRGRPSKGLIWGAVVTQIIWLEIEWDFSIGVGDAAELAIRFAEEVGTLTAGLIVLIIQGLRSQRGNQSQNG